MLRDGKPYAYDLYPPLLPETCPLCGKRLLGTEPLAGQLGCLTMGLPFLEFPVCQECQPRRFETAWWVTQGAIAVLITQFHLDSVMDWDADRDGPPFSEHTPDYAEQVAEPLLWIDDAIWQLRWLAELVPIPVALPRVDPALAHFSWQAEIGFPLLRWGARGLSPYTIHRLPPRTDEANDHYNLKEVTLPYVDELRSDTDDHWWGMTTWKLLPMRGDNEPLYRLAPFLRPSGGQPRGVSANSLSLFAFTGSAEWVVAGLPRDACHRPGFAQAWLKQVCDRQAALGETGIPVLPAACFYFLLRALETNPLPTADSVFAFLEAVEPAMHAVTSMVHRCFVEKVGWETLAEPLPDHDLRDWATRYVQQNRQIDAVSGTYNQTVALDHVAQIVSAAGFPAQLAAQRRQQSGPEWKALDFWRPDLDELAVIGLWVRSGGRRYGKEMDVLSVGGVDLTAETERFAEAWRQWVDLQVWPTPSAAGLEFLFPGLKLTPTAAYDWHVAEIYQQTTGHKMESALLKTTPGESDSGHHQKILDEIAQAESSLQAVDIDEARCFNVARGLLEDAQVHRQYVPLGGYRIMLPADMMLRKVVGIQALRLWFEPAPEGEMPPEGCWVKDDVIIASPEGQLARGNAWWWSWANFAHNQSGVPEFLWPNLAAVLAAIYRDLVVAGEAVMLETRSRPDGLPPLAWGGTPVHTATRHRHAGKRDLPGRRYEVRGYPARNIQWGDPEEMDRVRRAAHAVRGHVMRLAPGRQASARALERGQAYGLIPAVGYTFVRPHIRGLDPARAADEADAETLTSQVRARGLYSLLAYLSAPASPTAPDTE